jgi:hypothetical protein
VGRRPSHHARRHGSVTLAGLLPDHPTDVRRLLHSRTLLERSLAAGISGPWAEGAAVGVRGTPTVRLKCRRSVVAVPMPVAADRVNTVIGFLQQFLGVADPLGQQPWQWSGTGRCSEMVAQV